MLFLKKSFFVKLKFAENKIEVTALSTDVGEGIDFIEVDYDGPEIIVSFNPIFLLEPLTRLDSDLVEIKMNEGYSPVALSNSDGFLYVIMPMRKTLMLKEIALKNFRNYQNLSLKTNSDIVILYGNNGQGKTNFLEAVYYLAFFTII